MVRRLLTTLTFFCALLHAVPAQSLDFEEERTILDRDDRLSLTPQLSLYDGRVDRRRTMDAAVDQILLFPSAELMPAGTFSFYSHGFISVGFAWAFHDRVQAGIFGLLPLLGPSLLQVNGKFNLVRSPSFVFSLQPRIGHIETDDAEALGFSGAGLLDVLLSDSLILHIGLQAHLAMVLRADFEDASGCRTRAEFFEGLCIEVGRESLGMPSGGHYLAAHTGLTFYASDLISFRGELFSGLTFGSAMGLEAYSERDTSFDLRQALSSSTAAFGFPAGNHMGASFGVTFSGPRAAFQVGTYLLPALRLEIPVSPYASGRVHF